MNSIRKPIAELSLREIELVNGGIKISKYKYELGFTITTGVLAIAVTSVGIIPAGGAVVSGTVAGLYALLSLPAEGALFLGLGVTTSVAASMIYGSYFAKKNTAEKE